MEELPSESELQYNPTAIDKLQTDPITRVQPRDKLKDHKLRTKKERQMNQQRRTQTKKNLSNSQIRKEIQEGLE